MGLSLSVSFDDSTALQTLFSRKSCLENFRRPANFVCNTCRIDIMSGINSFCLFDILSDNDINQVRKIFLAE